MADQDWDVALVQCVSEKLNYPTKARELYISPWFTKAAAYAICVSEEWRILSAEYGLVLPDQTIAPYDKTLKDTPVRERRLWATRVIPELGRVVRPGDRVLMLAGVKYREFLVDPLLEFGCSVDIPMKGMKIGEQLHWLTEQLSRSCAA